MKKLLNEQLYISNSNPIKTRFYDYKHFTYPWHFHSEYELIYVEHGDGYCMIGDNMLTFTDYTLFFFGPNLPHWMQNNAEYETENNLRVNGTIIQFEKDFMQYSFSNYVQFKPIHNLLNTASNGIRFNLENYVKTRELISKIPQASEFRQLILLLELFQQLTQVSQDNLVVSPNYDVSQTEYNDNKIGKIIAFLNRNYTRQITLEEISSYSAMNPAAFCRFFKANTDKTFKEYINHLRVGYARKLLATNRLSMSQICYQCGFDSISYFNRCFKRITGCSPSEFKGKIFKTP